METNVKTSTTLLTLVIASASSMGDDVTLYASEGIHGGPSRCHTWVVFRRGEGRICISWMPANGRVRLLGEPVVGSNWDLEETLATESSLGNVYVYGPYECRTQLFDLAASRLAWLQTAARYKALDRYSRDIGAVNCITAALGVIPGPRPRTGLAYGRAATEIVLRHYRPYLLQEAATCVPSR